MTEGAIERAAEAAYTETFRGCDGILGQPLTWGRASEAVRQEWRVTARVVASQLAQDDRPSQEQICESV